MNYKIIEIKLIKVLLSVYKIKFKLCNKTFKN